MGFDNIIAGNGVEIAITGMTVVFTGLVLVSLYITALPRLLERASRKGRRGAPRTKPAHATAGSRVASPGIDPDLLAAIGCVLQAEYERELLSDHQLITIREDDEEQRVWTAIGKMRSLATRL
jgi:Na+-transporting methylmalonyl-CoA/oxaloacetate decarboxylase gamma subunit